MTLTQLYCDVDDFCQGFVPEWERTQREDNDRKRLKKRCLESSEIITLVIYYYHKG